MQKKIIAKCNRFHGSAALLPRLFVVDAMATAATVEAEAKAAVISHGWTWKDGCRR
jgi:hypothetical protein